MNFTKITSSRDLYGLYEITPEGKIIYCRIRTKNALINSKPENVGKNLFDEVIEFDNTVDFRSLIEKFWDGAENTQSFLFTSRFSKSELPLKVLLLRVNQSNYPDVEKFMIVDIRKFKPTPNLLKKFY